MKRIVYTQANGMVAIVHPAVNDPINGYVPEKETEDEYMERILLRSVPEDCRATARYVEIEQIPSDRYFRDAWTDEYPTDTVDINMDKARQIQMDKIRIPRNEKLKELDLEVMKALETNDPARIAELASLKQELRDIPQTFDLSVYDTPEGLKEAMPAQLLPETK